MATDYRKILDSKMNQNKIEESKTEIDDLRALLQTKTDQVLIMSLISETINNQMNDGIDHDAKSVLEMIDSWRRTHRKTIRRLNGNDE